MAAKKKTCDLYYKLLKAVHPDLCPESMDSAEKIKTLKRYRYDEETLTLYSAKWGFMVKGDVVIFVSTPAVNKSDTKISNDLVVVEDWTCASRELSMLSRYKIYMHDFTALNDNFELTAHTKFKEEYDVFHSDMKALVKMVVCSKHTKYFSEIYKNKVYEFGCDDDSWGNYVTRFWMSGFYYKEMKPNTLHVFVETTGTVERMVKKEVVKYEFVFTENMLNKTYDDLMKELEENYETVKIEVGKIVSLHKFHRMKKTAMEELSTGGGVYIDKTRTTIGLEKWKDGIDTTVEGYNVVKKVRTEKEAHADMIASNAKVEAWLAKGAEKRKLIDVASCKEKEEMAAAKAAKVAAKKVEDAKNVVRRKEHAAKVEAMWAKEKADREAFKASPEMNSYASGGT